MGAIYENMDQKCIKKAGGLSPICRRGTRALNSAVN